jgi:hypothetical protein
MQRDPVQRARSGVCPAGPERPPAAIDELDARRGEHADARSAGQPYAEQRHPKAPGRMAAVTHGRRTAGESGRQDLNLRPPGPQPGALPDCATPRDQAIITVRVVGESGRRESNPP